MAHFLSIIIVVVVAAAVVQLPCVVAAIVRNYRQQYETVAYDKNPWDSQLCHSLEL